MRHRATLTGAFLALVFCTTVCIADPIMFEDGKAKQLVCNTKALDLSASPFKETVGSFTIRLTVTGTEAGNRIGRWSVAGVDQNHTGSFAAKNKDNCAKSACVIRIAPKKAPELWAPKPMSLDKLGKDERLTLVVIEEKTLKLKGTVFLGKAPDVLENGTCKEPQPASEKMLKDDAPEQDDAKQDKNETDK